MAFTPNRTGLRPALVALLLAVSSGYGQPADSRLTRINDTKSIKVAYRVDSRPFSSLNEQREPVGYTIDLCKLVVHSIAQRLNTQLLLTRQ